MPFLQTLAKSPFEEHFTNRHDDNYMVFLLPEILSRRQTLHKKHPEKAVSTKDHFSVNLDVQQFKPEEITVKVIDENMVHIEGKHEEKQDEHGSVFRHFVRKYRVPIGFNLEKIVSNLSADGVITVHVPKLEQNAVEHKEIPIILTGKTMRAPVEEKKVEDAKPAIEL